MLKMNTVGMMMESVSIISPLEMVRINTRYLNLIEALSMFRVQKGSPDKIAQQVEEICANNLIGPFNYFKNLKPGIITPNVAS